MPMMTLNLALLFVFQFALLQFLFVHRENLLHRSFEFRGWFLLRCCWHGSHSTRFHNVAQTYNQYHLRLGATTENKLA